MAMWTPEWPCILLMFTPAFPIIAPACAGADAETRCRQRFRRDARSEPDIFLQEEY